MSALFTRQCDLFRYVVAYLLGPFLLLAAGPASAQAPVALCTDDLNISLSGVGYAAVFAAEVDAGSYAEIGGPVRLEVRRSLQSFAAEPGPGAAVGSMGAWSSQVAFDCSDAGRYVRIELRVWDNANGDGVVGGPGDASNVCWLDVLIENKIPPSCVPPAPVSLECENLPVGFPSDLAAAYALDPAGTTALLTDLFGTATATSSCGATLTELAPLDNRSCGAGVITRRFEASSTGSNGVEGTDICTQQITVASYHEYAIQFPADAASSDCLPASGAAVSGIEIGCDLLSYYQDTVQFFATGDECYKQRIDIQVINWCEYDGIGDPYVIGRDEDGDNLAGEEVWVTVAQDEATVRSTQFGPVLRTIGDYATSSSRGYFQYYQFLKVYDNQAPVIEITAAEDSICSLRSDCLGTATVSFAVSDNCTQKEEWTVSATLDRFIVDTNGDGLITLAEFTPEQSVTVTEAAGGYTVVADLPYGQHAFRLTAADGCGNTTAELVVFEILDCKAPTPICINDLTATLMPTPEGGAAMEIAALDYIASPSEDCSGIAGYAIYRTTEVLAAGDDFVPELSATSLLLGCDDVGMLAVRIYAIDGVGNADYCETSVQVQANIPGLCAGSGSIAGIIATENNAPVAGVTVAISGAVTQTVETDAAGGYHSGPLPLDEDYTVTPSSQAMDYKEGVSTFDIVAIQKHILGLQTFSSPYQWVAADTNGDAHVSTLDLIFLRRLILNLDDTLPNSPSWRFVAADYEFPGSLNPWQQVFPEIFNANDLSGDIEADFVGVKIGDVNGSAGSN
jgi:hypothetical protein